MHEYTLTIQLDDDQQRRLERIVEACNRNARERYGENADAIMLDNAGAFHMLMLGGVWYDINYRLETWERSLHISVWEAKPDAAT